MLNSNTKYHINPTPAALSLGDRWVCGVTGRKIIVDSYGGYSRHARWRVSGKDPSKVGPLRVYMARYIAKKKW